MYEGIYQSPRQTHSFITNYLLDLRSPSKPIPGRIHAMAGIDPRPSTEHRWIPPPDDHAKLNVDGAVDTQGQRGAIAAACRDRDGLFLGSSVVVFAGITDPKTLEVFAAREALALAADLNLQSIHIASDCEWVIKDIKHDSAGLQGAIIREINISRKAFTSCNFSHERRVFNFEPHNLAKFGCSLGPGRHIWLGIPHDQNLVPMNIVMNQ